ncbi:MAG TPA: DUF4058 family protein [Tepidisphaeraceae bacterium]
MASPFPGMDPYLESRWRDVHTALVAGARAALNEELPPGLIARAEERVSIASDRSGSPQFSPDVSLLELVGAAQGGGSTSSAGGWEAPYRLTALIEPLTERYIEIIESTGERLITVIEFVSPTNKRGEGLRAFVENRSTLLRGGVNFVEIDLTRGGDWRGLLLPHHCPSEAVTPYRATIRIPRDSLIAYFYPIDMRHPVKDLPIPLRTDDGAVDLPIQKLVEQAYRTGRYDQSIDYAKSIDPPLEGPDDTWADALLRSAGKR